MDEIERQLRLLDEKVNEIVHEDESKFISKEQAIQVAAGDKNESLIEEIRQKEQHKRTLDKIKQEKPKKIVRGNADKVWTDQSLSEWPENDYRIFVKDLPVTANDKMLADHFKRFKSFAKAKVIFDSSGRNLRYGFVSLLDVTDYIEAMKALNNSFIDTNRIKLLPSKWKDKSLKNARNQ